VTSKGEIGGIRAWGTVGDTDLWKGEWRIRERSAHSVVRGEHKLEEGSGHSGGAHTVVAEKRRKELHTGGVQTLGERSAHSVVRGEHKLGERSETQGVWGDVAERKSLFDRRALPLFLDLHA
jgi:hypothetical protein